MKTVVVLSILLCAAFAAPAEDKEKAPEAAVVALKEQMVPAPETEEKMRKDEVFVPEDSVPVHSNEHVFEKAAGSESGYSFCPDGWYNHGPRCFKVIRSAMTWYKAEEHCNSLDANLASATSAREYSFLQEITKLNGQSCAWLGGFRLQNTWMWINREGFYYKNWNYESTSVSLPCLYLNTNYGWKNTQCSSSFYFICSKNPFGC
ncbi:ladderlectin-like [Cottoperca gobio]|uniref:Ladderlectin-like n=1 Tax=Cottoperca gobio TaxID=56716 RepID=A0A6J2QH67_COTGO|nr:ladderlectin-like [Cottoperca gobio]